MRTANAALTALLNGQKKALLFDGSTQQASLPQVNIGASNMSVECWANLIAKPSVSNAGIIAVGGGVGRFWLYAAATGAVGINTTWGVSDLYSTQVVPALGSWHHYGVRCDRSGLQRFFFDGAPVDGGQSMVSAYGLNWVTTNWLLSGVINVRANCMIDAVRRYSRLLTDTEFAEHALGIYRDESGLIGYWDFDEGSGSTLFDLSGKGNNGSMTASPPFVDFNPSPGTERQFRIADLLTITLVNGAALRYTSADFDITSGGNLFSSKGPLFKRSKTKMVVGITVDEMELSVFPTSSDLISGQPFMQAVKLGVFDGATVTVERAFMPAWGNVSAGTLVMFSGRMGPADATRSEARFKVNSDLELLNIPMPRNIYQPGCMKTVYDAACTLVKANYVVRGVVTSGTASVVNASTVATASGEFDLGTIEFEAAVSLPGGAGNYASTPDAAANRITGDIDIRSKVALTVWPPASFSSILSKRNGSTPATACYVFGVNGTDGKLLFFWSDGTSQFIDYSTVAPTVANGAALWVRATLTVNNGTGGNDVRFYTSTDGITWTQLGATVTTAGVTSIRAGSDYMEIGSQIANTASFLQGKVYYAEIRNGINGTIVAKFDPTNDTPQGANLLSSTGELWSMNGTAALVGMTNRGQRRTVKSYTPGVFTLIRPLPNVPVAGDLFAAYPGCDKQQSTCGVNVGITYTADSTTDALTATAHGLVNDKAVKLSTTGTFPGAAIALDAVTAYFVVNATANTFQLARNIGGVAIDITSNGTGTNKIAQAGKFANLAHFRGTPKVPVPETMI